MKWLILALVFLAAIVVGFEIAQDPGYALFVYKNWMVQMPLWLALLIFLLCLFFLAIFSRGISGFVALKRSTSTWWRWHHYRQTSQDIQKRVTRYAHISQLIATGQQEEAEKALRKILKQQLNDEALRLYQSLDISPEKRYKLALSWQKNNPSNPALLALLGKLASELKLWGLARKYYTESLELSFAPYVSLLYADFLMTQSEKDAALTYYQKGLVIATSQNFLS